MIEVLLDGQEGRTILLYTNKADAFDAASFIVRSTGWKRVRIFDQDRHSVLWEVRRPFGVGAGNDDHATALDALAKKARAARSGG